MAEKKIKFMDLSMPLKILVIYWWINLSITVLFFIAALLTGGDF